jgi:hypothetical protein
MAAKIINPKQATKELERRFREETQRLRQQPSEGSEGYTNVYTEEEPEQREEEQEEQSLSNQETNQSSTPQPRLRQRRSRRPTESSETAQPAEPGGEPEPTGTPEPSSSAGQPTSAVPSEQLSRGAQFAERTKALQQTAGAVQRAAQTARNVAATVQRAAAVGRVIAFLFSPVMWPVWIGLAIAAGILFVILLLVIVACAVTPDWVPPYGMTATLFEAVKWLASRFSEIKCT